MSETYLLHTRAGTIPLLEIEDDEPGHTAHLMIDREQAVRLLAEHGATGDHLPPPEQCFDSWAEAAPGTF